MLRYLNIILLIFLCCVGVFCQEEEESQTITYDKNGAPILSCKAFCLMDADNGQVLYSNNQYMHLPNASTTKLMTCILVMEKLSPDDMLTASENVSQTPYTSLYLSKGEKISVRDALAGAVIKSANDTCVLFAEAISGDTRKFSAMMNQKALELGMTDTHFVNPHGLYDDNHYSSAYDMCLLGREALKYPLISEFAMTRKYVLDSRTENRQNVLIYNKTRFTKLYKYATGLKAGYVKQAGNCLVGSAEKDGVRLVSCILNSSQVTDETIALMDYGFGAFKKEVLLGADAFSEEYSVANSSGKVTGVLASDLTYLRRKNDNKTKCEIKYVVSNELTAPIKSGDVIGKAKAFAGLQEVAVVDIVARESVEPDKLHSVGILLTGIGLFVWKAIKVLLIIILVILILAGIIASGRKIAKNNGKGRSRLTKKMRRNHSRRTGYSRRNKSVFRPQSRPGNKRDKS